jgi:pimeloyl-ACP methyl ester carboxylesterase
VRFVTVAPGVSLEVLDWGGSGPPLVFLSGLQDVAHGFDDFAPQFTDQFHVLGITRRGYGASSQPAGGYDIGTRVADLRAVLDSLGLSRVALVGHSIAGDELTALAGTAPERVSHLVYLDAAYDHSGLDTLLGAYPAPPPMLSVDSASPAAVQRYTERVFGMRIPEAQLRAIGRYDAAGKLSANVTPTVIDSLMLAGCGHPDWSAVQAPALMIDAVIDSAPQIFPAWSQYDSVSQAAGRRFATAIEGWATEQRAIRSRALPRARVVPLHGANHYVFDSHGTPVAKAMRRFLSPP